MTLHFRKVFKEVEYTLYFMKRYPTTLVDSALWDRFMNEIGRRKGIKRGAIQESLEEAIGLWIDDNDE